MTRLTKSEKVVTLAFLGAATTFSLAALVAAIPDQQTVLASMESAATTTTTTTSTSTTTSTVVVVTTVTPTTRDFDWDKSNGDWRDHLEEVRSSMARYGYMSLLLVNRDQMEDACRKGLKVIESSPELTPDAALNESRAQAIEAARTLFASCHRPLVSETEYAVYDQALKEIESQIAELES